MCYEFEDRSFKKEFKVLTEAKGVQRGILRCKTAEFTTPQETEILT